MNNLYFMTETSAFLGYYPFICDILSFLSIICAILVIITKNPVVSVLYLILLFVLIGCYLIFLGMTFLGLSYLLVYIGAIAILFLFIIMLLDIKSSELMNINRNSNVLGFILTVLFFYPIYSLLPFSLNFYYNFTSYIFHTLNSLNTTWSRPALDKLTNINSQSKDYVLEKTNFMDYTSPVQDMINQSHPNIIASVYNIDWQTSINSYNHVSVIGNMMYNNYVLWLFLTGFILLLALIGSIALISVSTHSKTKT